MGMDIDVSAAVRRPTLRDVAQIAGVSTATASYVLSGRSKGRSAASQATKRRVEQAAERLGYQANRAARAMRTGRTGLVVLCLTALADDWTQALISTVQAQAAALGMTALIIADTDWFPALQTLDFDVALVSQTDSYPDSQSRLELLAQHGKRIVVFRPDIEARGFDVLSTEHGVAAAMGTRFLIDRFGEFVGFFGLEFEGSHWRQSSVREESFRAEMASAGVQVRENWVARGGPGRAAIVGRARELLTRQPRPRAILTGTTSSGIILLEVAQALQLHLPDDIALLALGDIAPDNQTQPRLSYVGVGPVFDHVARILMDTAQRNIRRPGRKTEYSWEIFDEETT